MLSEFIIQLVYFIFSTRKGVQNGSEQTKGYVIFSIRTDTKIDSKQDGHLNTQNQHQNATIMHNAKMQHVKCNTVKYALLKQVSDKNCAINNIRSLKNKRRLRQVYL